MNRKTHTILALLLLAAAAANGQTETTRAPEMNQVMRVATEGLATLRELAGKMSGATGLTAEEAAQARLGTPLRVFFVPLGALKEYRGDKDPRALLSDAKSFLFPITVGSETRSSLTVKELQGNLAASDFGQAELAKRIASVRGDASDAKAVLVRVPALNLFFIGHTEGAFTLTPIADVPGSDLPAGRAADAAEVFKVLSAMAQKLTGDPT